MQRIHEWFSCNLNYHIKKHSLARECEGKNALCTDDDAKEIIVEIDISFSE